MLDIVRRYVALRRNGNRWVAPCPFHQETKPSFSVNEEEGFFYCFGCQAAGDLFDFYGRINGLDFKETLEQLAEEAGVSLNKTAFKADPKAKAERDLKKTAQSMYTVAAKTYTGYLASPTGAVCREYLIRRKLDQPIIERFGLGWSPDQWQSLADTLRRGGFSLQDGVSAGLLVASDKGGFYDRFRSRLMFPIKNLSGQVIAFGGRIIGNEDAAKYINSADSPIYKKGDNLYGLYEARRAIAIKKSAMLTEGYMDVITLHQFGYENACGALGTALTDEQVRRLAGFCSDFELIYDGDAPGQKAALKAADMFLRKGLRCKVVLLPEKEDIDSLLHEQGTAAFEELRSFAPDGLDFCIRSLSSGFAPKDILEWVKDFILHVEQPELRARYTSRLTQALDIDEVEIRRVMAKKSPSQNEGPTGPSGAGGPTAEGSAQKNALDREICKFLVRHPQMLPALGNAGAKLLMQEAWALSFWDKIAGCAPEYALDDIFRLLSSKEKEFWVYYRVKVAPPPGNEQKELEEICSVVARHCMNKHDSACVQAMRQSTPSGDDADFALLKAVNETLVQRRSLGSKNGEY